MISSCRVVTALALITRAPLIYRLVERLVFTPCFNRVSPHTPLVPSTLARARRAYPSQAQLGYTGAGRSAPHLVLIMFQLAFPLSQARTPWTRQARLRSPKACVRGHDRSLPHLFLIGFRPATRLMISSCRVVTALALITRAPPYLPPC